MDPSSQVKATRSRRPKSHPADTEQRDFIARCSLSEAVRGNFSDLTKLVGHEQTCGGFDTIKRLLNTTSEPSQRNLLHWAAFHNNLEILKWYCSMCSLFHDEFADYLNAQDVYGYTALHLATIADHEGIVQELLKHREVSICIAANKMLVCEENESKSNGLTPLHFAARNGSFPIVKLLLESLRNVEASKNLSAKSTSGKTVLHYAAEGGDWRVMRYLLEALKMCGKVQIVNGCDILRQTPLYLAASKQNVDALEILLREGEGLKVNTVTWEGITALDIAKRNEEQQKLEEMKKKSQRIVDMLESYDVNWLQAERQKYSNAANCLLVGAALVASVTYAGWLQPPLGLSQYYEFPTSNPAAPPGGFESYVGVEHHAEIQMFWFFNSMSFFCSVATFIIGADAGIPDKSASLREEVVQLRNSVVKASLVLSVAILFVIGAFATAGILVLPPIQRQRAPMYVTVAIGVTLCLTLLVFFVRKLWKWFCSPSLHFMRDKRHLSIELAPTDPPELNSISPDGNHTTQGRGERPAPDQLARDGSVRPLDQPINSGPQRNEPIDDGPFGHPSFQVDQPTDFWSSCIDPKSIAVIEPLEEHHFSSLPSTVRKS